MIKSKDKGKRYELEIAHWLSAHIGPARRGQQFCGRPESPDVICEALPGVHVECKHNNRLVLYQAMDQAIRDAGSLLPVVIHRHDNKPSLVTVQLSDLADLAMQIAMAMEGGNGIPGESTD